MGITKALWAYPDDFVTDSQTFIGPSVKKVTCRVAVIQRFYKIGQGMVDGSESKPALRQDTGYMVEKTYLAISPYLGAFGAYLMPQ